MFESSDSSLLSRELDFDAKKGAVFVYKVLGREVVRTKKGEIV